MFLLHGIKFLPPQLQCAPLILPRHSFFWRGQGEGRDQVCPKIDDLYHYLTLFNQNPATLIQKPSEATMTYVAPTATLSGICNLRSPIAICTLNVYETGAAFPSAGLPGKSSTTTRGGGQTIRPGTALLGSATSSMGGFVFALTTVVLGFAISVALMR